MRNKFYVHVYQDEPERVANDARFPVYESDLPASYVEKLEEWQDRAELEFRTDVFRWLSATKTSKKVLIRTANSQDSLMLQGHLDQAEPGIFSGELTEQLVGILPLLHPSEMAINDGLERFWQYDSWDAMFLYLEPGEVRAIRQMARSAREAADRLIS